MAHEDHIPPGDPRYDGFRATSLWVVMGIDPKDDQEGIVSVPTASGGHRPLIASDERAVDHIVMWAQLMKRQGDEVSMRLVRFTERVELQEL